MNIIGWIRLALSIWQMIAPATKTTADDKISAELQAALDAFEKVHGSDVTTVQLDQLRFVPRWGDAAPPPADPPPPPPPPPQV